MNNKSGGDAVLIVAGGNSTRMQSGPQQPPKQFLPLLGQSVLCHSVSRFLKHPQITDVFIAVDPTHLPHCEEFVQKPGVTVLTCAGTTRQETVRRALEEIDAKGEAPARILVHDGARPCWSDELLIRVLNAPTDQAVAPAIAVPDTLRRLPGGETLDRSGVHQVQTPQGFPFKRLLELHTLYADQTVTDDAALFEKAGDKVTYVEGDRDNLKITMPADMATAARIIASICSDIRTASGYDVHVFIPATPDRPLRLGGITIPHDMTLQGHSDADVVLHALTDALLGCIGAEDIGFHFKPSDARWKNADSVQFLAHARDMIMAKGGSIMHVDTTIICEAPKIGSHRTAMQARIADILRIDLGRVSIKATTSEGLGFTGRREGMAAQATATIRLPFTPESKAYA